MHQSLSFKSVSPNMRFRGWNSAEVTDRINYYLWAWRVFCCLRTQTYCSGRRFSPSRWRQATTGNTFAFAGYRKIVPRRSLQAKIISHALYNVFSHTGCSSHLIQSFFYKLVRDVLLASVMGKSPQTSKFAGEDTKVLIMQAKLVGG